MAATAWPFLVARTYSAGHRVVLAPDFMLAGDIHEWLGRVAAGSPTPPSELVHHALPDDISVLSRVVEPEGETYGIDVAGPLRDNFGRQIRITEGLVFRGMAPPAVTSEDLSVVHGAIAHAYQQAWLDDGTGVRTQPSTATPLPHTGTRFRVRPSPTASDKSLAVRRSTFSRQRSGIGWRIPALLSGLALVAGSAFAIPRILGSANSPEGPTSVASTTPNEKPAAQPACRTVTASCLVTGLTATSPPQVTVRPQDDGADTTLTRDQQCWHGNRGLGLRLHWAAGVPGRWELAWQPPAQPADTSSGIRTVTLSVRQQNGAERLQLVIKGPDGTETQVQVPLSGESGTWQRAEVVIPAANGGLASIQSFALEWTTSEPGNTGLCVDGISFH